jgi:hypothetical protein
MRMAGTNERGRITTRSLLPLASRNSSGRRLDCKGGVPGFMENLYLLICPAYRLAGQTASCYQKNFVTRLMRSAQNILQVLPCTLR